MPLFVFSYLNKIMQGVMFVKETFSNKQRKTMISAVYVPQEGFLNNANMSQFTDMSLEISDSMAHTILE